MVSRRRSLAWVCTVGCLLAGGSARAAISPPVPGDVLVCNGSTVTEYTPTGLTVQSFVIPSPTGTGNGVPRDLVVDPFGRLQVHNASSVQHYLSTYDFATSLWTHHTIVPWNNAGVTYYGAISADGSAVYGGDQVAPDAPPGIVRFPLNNLDSPTRFATDFDPHAIEVGLDGKIYALTRAGPNNLRVYDPTTMGLIRSVSTNTTGSVEGIAVAANGDLLLVDIDNSIYHEDPNGNLIKKVTSAGVYATDLDLTPDGRLWVGSPGGKVTLTTTDLSTFFTFSTPVAGGAFNNNFVAMAEPVPEPAAGGLVLLAAGLLAGRRWRPRRSA